MEQGSANRSPSTSLEQSKQPYFLGSNLNSELSHVVQPLLQGCSNDSEKCDSNAQTARFQPSNLEFLGSSQSKQADDRRPSLSSIPFSGDPRAQSQDGEDLFGVYLKGISSSHDEHLSKENQVSQSDNVVVPLGHDLFTHDAGNIRSHIHLSNLPVEYHSPASSSKYQGQWVGSSPISVPYGNLLGDSTIVNTIDPNWVTPGSSIPLRIGINQGIPNPMNATSVFNLGSSNTNFGSNYLRYGSTTNEATGSAHRAEGPTILEQKRKMTWEEDNITPNHRRWNLFMQGDLGKSSHASSERFTLYDKRYAEMGLPLDPHLRIFNAAKEKSTGKSKK